MKTNPPPTKTGKRIIPPRKEFVFTVSDGSTKVGEAMTAEGKAFTVIRRRKLRGGKFKYWLQGVRP